MNLQLISPASPDAVIEDMKMYIEEGNADLSNPRINTCRQYKNIAKRYLAIDELEDDNFVDIFLIKNMTLHFIHYIMTNIKINFHNIHLKINLKI